MLTVWYLGAMDVNVEAGMVLGLCRILLAKMEGAYCIPTWGSDIRRETKGGGEGCH